MEATQAQNSPSVDARSEPSHSRTPKLPPWMLPVALFIVALAAYVPSVAYHYANPDAYASSLAAWRIATTGEPWMEQVEFDQLTGISPTDRWTGPSENGHLVTTRMYGPILAAVPFYWVASNGDEAAFSVTRGGIAASTMVAAAAALLFLSVRRFVGDLVGAIGAGVFAFATPAWSVGADALWTHPMTMLGLAGAAYGSSRNRWWWVGISLGVGMLARPHLAVVAAVLGLGVAWSARNPRVVLAVSTPTAASLGILSLWNKYVFDSWRPLGAYAGRELSATVGAGPFGELGEIGLVRNLMGFLLSPDRGFLIWTPVLVLLLPAIVRAWPTAPAWTKWLAFGGVAYSMLQLSLNWFGGGDGFYGYRHALELLTCIMPLSVIAMKSAGRAARLLAPPVIALQFVAIMTGATTQRFMLNWSETWSANSFVEAVRTNPGVLIPLTLACVLVGGFIGVRLFTDEGSNVGRDLTQSPS